MKLYAAVFHGGSYYYFGGYSSAAIASILRLNGNSWTWSNVGQINTSRHGHRVMFVGNTFMVVGGGGTVGNEACVLANEQFTCTELSSSLTDYAWYPVLYLVDENYGNCSITSTTGTTTTTEPTSTALTSAQTETILVLNSNGGWKQAMLINSADQEKN